MDSQILNCEKSIQDLINQLDFDSLGIDHFTINNYSGIDTHLFLTKSNYKVYNNLKQFIIEYHYRLNKINTSILFSFYQTTIYKNKTFKTKNIFI